MSTSHRPASATLRTRVTFTVCVSVSAQAQAVHHGICIALFARRSEGELGGGGGGGVKGDALDAPSAAAAADELPEAFVRSAQQLTGLLIGDDLGDALRLLFLRGYGWLCRALLVGSVRSLLHRGMMRLAQRVHGEHHFLMSVPHGEAGEPQECPLGLGSARPAGGGEACCRRSS